MNRETFVNEILEPRLQKCKDVLGLKADEYATDDSAFYNFIRSAEINNESVSEALWGMASKHLVSIIDMIETDKPYESEYIEEKIGDMVNYLILLEGILKERNESKELHNIIDCTPEVEYFKKVTESTGRSYGI